MYCLEITYANNTAALVYCTSLYLVEIRQHIKKITNLNVIVHL